MALHFEHIVTVILENATQEAVLQNPYMSSLRGKGVFLQNAYGFTHPSQPNYIALVGGDTFGINSDKSLWVAPYVTNMQPIDDPPVTTIIDLVESKGLTWRVYCENLQPVDIVQPPAHFFPRVPPIPDPLPPYPPIGPPTPEGSDPLFARRHVPFLSYPNIVANPSRAAKIVNAQSTFSADLSAGQLPNYSWYIPNLVNDGHSILNAAGELVSGTGPVLIGNIAAFLEQFLGDDPVKRFPPKTLLVITFDEAFPYPDYCIYTLLIGDQLQAGTCRNEPYNHYSLLRSIEVNFGLGTLGRNDASAHPYWFLAEDQDSGRSRAAAAR